MQMAYLLRKVGKNKTKQNNQPNKSHPQTLNIFYLIPFPLRLHCRTKTVSQRRSFSFPHQLPPKSSKLRKIWWGALRTASNLSAHTHIQTHRKPNGRFSSREKTINLPELWEFPAGLWQSWDCACSLGKGTYEMQAEQSWLCS